MHYAVFDVVNREAHITRPVECSKKSHAESKDVVRFDLDSEIQQCII